MEINEKILEVVDEVLGRSYVGKYTNSRRGWQMGFERELMRVAVEEYLNQSEKEGVGE